jgi:hypothetical protein
MNSNTTIINSIFTSIFSILFFGNSFSQITVLNGGFEYGTDSTTTNWSTDIGSGRTDTFSHSFNYSMLCHNWYAYAEGRCVNGDESTQSTSMQWIKNGGTPFVQKPAYIEGYYRYDTTHTQSQNDSAVVEVYLKKYNNGLQTYDTVAFGVKHLPATDSAQGFVNFQVNIIDLMPGTNPDSIVIRLSSSINGMCDAGTTMECLYFYVDDLIAGFPLGVKTPIFGHIANVWPNPFENNLNILLTQNNNAIATIMDMNGKNILSKKIGSEHMLNLSCLKAGNYIININADGLNQTQKFVKK